MWPLSQPSFDARSTYQTCISNASARKRTVLESYEEPVAAAAERFTRACRDQNLHELKSEDFQPAPHLEDAVREEHSHDLQLVYVDRMARAGRPGYPIYNAIRNLTGKCPLCGFGRVASLDHHLPKSQFPLLSVTPTNLVPVCNDCNHRKAVYAPRNHAEQTLHPYFDDVDQDRWLRAQFQAGPSWAVKFRVDPPDHWGDELAARVLNHFEWFELNALYCALSAEELTEIAYELEVLHDGGGPELVRQHLLDTAQSRGKPHSNTWMVALYEALAANPEYCGGGFREFDV